MWLSDTAVCVAPVAAVALALAGCDWGGQPTDQLSDLRPDGDATVAELTAAVDAAAREPQVLQSHLAGSWYESDAGRLRRQLDRFLNKVPAQKRLEPICALILPHAGYIWSGQTAAYAIKQLRGRQFSRVVVIGPSHYLPMENVASVPNHTHYATPLGKTPLDTEFIAGMKRYCYFYTNPAAHAREHSVQIALPLLQHVLGQFKFVPVVVGQLDLETTRRMARILAGMIDGRTLVAASSDFTHYGLNYGFVPFVRDVPDNLKKLDMGAWERIRKKDLAGFFDYIGDTDATICGRHAIGLLLAMLPSDAEAHLLHYDTSGRISGDWTNSVSYLAIAFTGKWPKMERVQVQADERIELSVEEKRRLLCLARATLTFALEHGRMAAVDELGIEITPAMQQIAGAFVTLHKGGRLRGCIGEIIPTRPVYKAVMAQAINAGLRDTRFLPVSRAELPELELEVSVLTPPRPVSSHNEIELGKHGIVLEKHGASAVYLPQVAVEQGWDLATTLTNLSRKAGLPPDAWRSGCSFCVFEAIVFSEKQLLGEEQRGETK